MIFLSETLWTGTDQKEEQIVTRQFSSKSATTSAFLMSVLWGRDNPDVPAQTAKIHSDYNDTARLKSDTRPAPYIQICRALEDFSSNM